MSGKPPSKTSAATVGTKDKTPRTPKDQTPKDVKDRTQRERTPKEQEASGKKKPIVKIRTSRSRDKGEPPKKSGKEKRKASGGQQS